VNFREWGSSGAYPRIDATFVILFLLTFESAFFLLFLSRRIALIPQTDHPLCGGEHKWLLPLYLMKSEVISVQEMAWLTPLAIKEFSD